jgi:ABC-type dipeptide/oligopeptide/nickel transport system ATPase component
MSQKIVMIDITNELLTKYGAYMDKNISQVTLIQDDEIVELEIFWDERTPNKRVKQTIKRTDLSFIVDDPQVSEEPIFSVKKDIEENVEEFLNMTPVTLTYTTDLFSKEAAEKILKKYSLFGVDK